MEQFDKYTEFKSKSDFSCSKVRTGVKGDIFFKRFIRILFSLFIRSTSSLAPVKKWGESERDRDEGEDEGKGR